MYGLSEKQRELLTFLADSLAEGQCPSVQEMAKFQRVAPSMVRRRLKALEEKRYIKRQAGRQRQVYILRVI